LFKITHLCTFKRRFLMSINQGLFSSETDLWATPQNFFDKLNEEFQFEIDVCALPENAKCSTYFTPEQNGLEQEWKGKCWLNPPYGREIAKWVKKAYESSLNGATVVCLLPARTDTKWWHDYCMKGEIRLVKGRLKFGGKSIKKIEYPDFNDLDKEGQPRIKIKYEEAINVNNAPFPSAVVVFGENAKVSNLKVI
jgi:phage N-6-adenine-methyltransferase